MRIKKLTLSNLIVLICIIFIVAIIGIFLSNGMSYPPIYQMGEDNSSGKTAQTIDDRYLLIIREASKRAGLSDLKSEMLPKNATEIRFWIGFSHNELRGLIIKNDGVTWSATFISNFPEGASSSDISRPLDPPANGWQYLIDKLQQLGLYDLIGESGNIPKRKFVLDVTSTVVEIKTSNSYKALRYYGVFSFQDEEIIKMEKILQTLSSEFSIKLY
jgi:hypothetical protein